MYKCKVPFSIMQKRSEFKALAKTRAKHIAPAFLVVTGKREACEIRVGFTASKKIGGAVARFRAKRRMRALVDDLIRLNPNFINEGLTLVMIARKQILTRNYEKMKSEFKEILRKNSCIL